MEGWKTVMFNMLVGLHGVMVMMGVGLPEDMAAQTTDAVTNVVGAGEALWAVANIYLRSITTTPVGWKK